MTRPTFRPAILAAVLLAWVPPGCSDRPAPAPASKASRRLEGFRVVKFAGENVVVPFRPGLPTAPIERIILGDDPKPGDRVALGGPGKGEVFLALDLDALRFYHATPGPSELERFRRLGDEGRLFVVARGTTGTVVRVVEGELPDGLQAIELRLADPGGGAAWVSDPFVHRVEGGRP